VKGISVFGKAFSFAGGAGTKSLVSSISQASPLSKGGVTRGAAEETPILSRQRVGDKGCPTETPRRGARHVRVLRSTPSTLNGS